MGADLFQWKQATYLLIIDYFSRYIKIAKISGATAIAVISQIKSIFVRRGVPQELFSDNGPQFSSGEFTQFAKNTTSPTPQAAPGTLKQMVRQNEQ